MITVSPGGKICTPKEVLTIARSAQRGLLLEVVSDNGKPYTLLLRSGKNGALEAVHKCYAVEKNLACKHLRSAIFFTERWLDTKLPRKVDVSLRWLEKSELIASEDLTPMLLGREGKFKTIKLNKTRREVK